MKQQDAEIAFLLVFCGYTDYEARLCQIKIAFDTLSPAQHKRHHIHHDNTVTPAA